MTDTRLDAPPAAPAAEATADAALAERVEVVLDTLRPAIAMDGGAVELLGIQDRVATVRLVGACAGCPMSMMTLKRGIEQRIKAAVPEIARVDAV
ncbi:MAG TPA: NifU family protein [Gemmatimonadota bacterium]|jgi:Fe-S cluster biogenesis protein NfuA